MSMLLYALSHNVVYRGMPDAGKSDNDEDSAGAVRGRSGDGSGAH